MERRIGVYGAGPDMIAAFKDRWPAHGFPAELNCVVAHFDSRGDLVELEAFIADGNPLDTADFDGPALKALVDDIQDHGYLARPLGT